MKVLGRFRKPNGELTPTMTAKEINAGKYQEYEVADEQLKNMFFRAIKYLIEAANPGVTISRR